MRSTSGYDNTGPQVSAGGDDSAIIDLNIF
jgi:hypothetical protein